MGCVLAIVGLAGSGKTTVVEYLEKKGWQRIYLGKETFEELKRRGLEVNEKNERMVREDIRKKEGMDAYAKRCLPRIKTALQQGNVVVESMYSWEEYLLLKGEFGGNMHVAAVFAGTGLRQKRLAERKYRGLTAEELESRDRAQIEKLNIAGPIAKADYTIINTGTIKELYAQVDKIIGELNG